MTAKIIILCVLAIVGAVLWSPPNDTWRRSATERASEPQRAYTILPPGFKESAEQLRRDYAAVKISNTRWEKGAFGNIAIFHFTIENGTARQIKDIVVTCKFNGASGTHIQTARRTVYSAIKPKSKKKLTDLNFGFIDSQVAGASCDISDFV